jgi:RNA polymerase sigma-70 factor (ECF subfamily)
MLTDSQLIREIKDGNVEMYAELMNRYQKKIYAFVYHMLKSANLELMAEDLCSEAFYKAYRSLHSFREVDASFSTWLYTIARNTVLSELRKMRMTQVSLDDTVYIPAAPAETGPEQSLLRHEKAMLVREAINSLPEKQRSALILREYEGLDYQEIANILDQTVSSVKSLLFRARASVKAQLESYMGEPVMMREFEEMKMR